MLQHGVRRCNMVCLLQVTESTDAELNSRDMRRPSLGAAVAVRMQSSAAADADVRSSGDLT